MRFQQSAGFSGFLNAIPSEGGILPAFANKRESQVRAVAAKDDADANSEKAYQ